MNVRISFVTGMLALSLSAFAADEYAERREIAFDASLRGKRVMTEVEVENTGDYLVMGQIKLLQYDAAGKLLREQVVDPRWTTMLRPPHKRHTMRVEGSVHPKTAKIEMVKRIAGKKPEWMKCADADVTVGKVVVKALEERPVNPGFFADGKDGRGLKLEKGRVVYFPVYTRSVWGQSMKPLAEESFFSLEAAEVAIDVCPGENAASARIVNAVNAKDNSRGIDYFGVEWDPVNKTLSAYLRGVDGKLFTAKGKAELPAGKWQAVKACYAAGDKLVLSLDGKTIGETPLADYKPAPVGDETKGVHLFAVGGDMISASRATSPKAAKGFTGVVDNLRITSGGKIRAEFGYENTIYGKSEVADGNVEGSILADEALYPGKRKSKFDLWPGEFDVLNYKELASDADLKAARKFASVTRKAKAGETLSLDLPEGAIPVYTEIANRGKEAIYAPFVRHPDEVDPRSWETMRETMKLEGLGDEEKALKIFQWVIGRLDYFICHPAFVTTPDGNQPQMGCNFPLKNLNISGADMCGGVNRIVANALAHCGDLPTEVVSGYGHEFQQVFLDGMLRTFDMSGQRCFRSLTDDHPSSLQELEREIGMFSRYRVNSSHFVRLFHHGPRGNQPDCSRRFFFPLRPGESLRWYRNNDGTQNDVWYGKGGYFKHPLTADKPEGCDIKGGYLMNRFQPESANGFVIYEGAQLEKEYKVDFVYTALRGRYRAVNSAGKALELEYSKDGRRHWQPIAADADGWAHLAYEIRSLPRYYVRTKGGTPAKFCCETELMMNPRCLTGLARPGKGDYLFTTQDGKGGAEVTVAYKVPAGEVEVEGAVSWGAVRGAERTLLAYDPSEGGKSVAVKGATVKSVKLDFADRGAPYYTNVVLKTSAGGSKVLTVLVGRGAQLLRLGKDGNGLAFSKKGEKTKVDFKPVGGRFMLFNLTQMDGGHRVGGPRERPLCYIDETVKKTSYTRFKPCGGGNGPADYFKAPFGVNGGKAHRRWSYPAQKGTRYPTQAPMVIEDGKCDHARYEMHDDLEGGLEFFAVLVIPEGDHEFQGETLKLFQGLNYDPMLRTGAWVTGN